MIDQPISSSTFLFVPGIRCLAAHLTSCTPSFPTTISSSQNDFDIQDWSMKKHDWLERESEEQRDFRYFSKRGTISVVAHNFLAKKKKKKPRKDKLLRVIHLSFGFFPSETVIHHSAKRPNFFFILKGILSFTKKIVYAEKRVFFSF